MNLPITIAEQGAFQSSYSNESNNYTIIGKNILQGVCLGVGVIGAVVVAKEKAPVGDSQPGRFCMSLASPASGGAILSAIYVVSF